MNMSIFQYHAALARIDREHASNVALAKEHPVPAVRAGMLRRLDAEKRAARARLDKEAGVTR